MKKATLLFFFGFFILFIGTWQETGVTGKDEYWVTLRTPLEMMETGSYWTLRLNDEVRLEKPPLIYWFIVATYRMFGINLAAARLVGVLSGAGMAFLATRLYQRLFDRSGFLAGIFLLATAGVAVEGRRAMLDMPLGVFCFLSVYLCVAAVQDRKVWKFAAAGAALAAATLAKGPQSLLFVLPALILGWCFIPRRPPWRSLLVPFLLFTGVFLLLALPWPLSMRILHADFINELQNQIVSERLNRVSFSSPLNALGGTLLLAFPWSFLLITAIIMCFRGKNDDPEVRKARWLAGWLLLCVLPFFFMRSFERYMIPILPCAAVLLCWGLEKLRPLPRRILLIVSCYLMAIVSIVFSGFALWFGLSGWIAGMTLVLTFWMLWTASAKTRPDRPVIAVAWVFFFILGLLYPQMGINRMPDDLPWEELRAHPVGIYSGYSQPAMLSMRLERSVDFPFEDRLVAQGYNGYIFTTHDQFDDPERIDTLTHALRSARIPFERVGSYPVLFSRRNWIRFTRPGADRTDWLQAFAERDLRGLKSEIIYVKTGDLLQSP